MTHEELEQLCLALPGTSFDYPFGEGTRVYRVRRKLFAIVFEADGPPRVNLKCEPLLAIQLRAEFAEQIQPGYHMNKQHWNTVIMDGSLPGALETELVEDSYDLIVASLPRAQRPTGV